MSSFQRTTSNREITTVRVPSVNEDMYTTISETWASLNQNSAYGLRAFVYTSTLYGDTGS